MQTRLLPIRSGTRGNHIRFHQTPADATERQIRRILLVSYMGKPKLHRMLPSGIEHLQHAPT